jgi:Clp amino terminal domain, pathogenicity island component
MLGRLGVRSGTDMYERFPDEARLTVEGAREQARQLGGGAVGSEHLLLSVLIEGNGTTSRTVEMLAVDPDAIRAGALAAAVPYQPRKRGPGCCPLGSRPRLARSSVQAQ